MTKKAQVIAFGAGLLLALALLLLLSGCLEGPPLHTAPRPPIEVDLSMEGSPALGKEVNLTVKVKPHVDIPNITVWISLPSEMEGVSGEMRWQGDLRKEETKQLKVTARTVKDGYYKIWGGAQAKLPYGFFREGDVLYLLVEGSEAGVGKRPPKNNWVPNNVGIGGPHNSHLARARLYLTEEIALEKETELIYEITPSIDLSNVSIGFILPKAGLSVTKVEGPSQVSLSRRSGEWEGVLSWEGAMARGEKVVIKVRIKPITTGEGVLEAYMEARQKGKIIVSRSDSIKVKLYTPRMAE
jgi:hypothetical protein